MNGFISPKALRFTLVASVCLLSGFVSGASFPSIELDKIFPEQEINYSKISWISSVFEEKKISLATVDYPASPLANQEIKLAEFHLPTKKFFAKKAVLPVHHLTKVNRTVAKSKASTPNRFDIFKDYRNAAAKMHRQFTYVMSKPEKKIEVVAMTDSSAELSLDPVLDAPYIQVKQSAPDQLPRKNKVSSIVPKLKKRSLSIQKMNTQKVAVLPKSTPVESVLERTITEKPEPIQIKTSQSSAVLSNRIEEETKKAEDESLGHKLENQLLEQHIQTYQTQVANQQKVARYAIQTSTKRVPPPVAQPEDEIDHNNDVQNIAPVEKEKDLHPLNECKILPKMHLTKPQPEAMSENIQICPSQKTWISKSWNEEGWVKAEVEGFFPVMTYYPQVSSNKTLLLDQNSVALLAIRSGVHFAHGTGMILGTVPQGYKIEFSGRAEEAQYFDLDNKKYFVLLNVEPGAGVIELVSEKNQIENATVFTPVLSDTVTYLDLAAPISVSIPVKIVKNSQEQSDVSGLTVGVSTQTQIQAITQANGMAFLKNVKMVPGYPVFVDVSSKLNGERSYQYRYQLNKRTRAGVFVLKQYSEKLVHQWLRQVKTSISDQSGMIFGSFNKKRINQRQNYSVKVDSITEKFGLTAKNYSILVDETLKEQEPIENMDPRFLAVQVPEGLAQAHLINEKNEVLLSTLIPVSPRVINVISE